MVSDSCVSELSACNVNVLSLLNNKIIFTKCQSMSNRALTIAYDFFYFIYLFLVCAHLLVYERTQVWSLILYKKIIA